LRKRVRGTVHIRIIVICEAGTQKGDFVVKIVFLTLAFILVS
jgi:hypothetical protein